MFHPSESSNKVAQETIHLKSQPRKIQTFTWMGDDLLAAVVDTEPVAYTLDSNMGITKKTPEDQPAMPQPPHGQKVMVDQAPEKPRRALSAYNIFFHDQREQIKKELTEASSVMTMIIENQQRNYHHQQETHRGKMLFAELARTIATRWKAIDSETRARYEELATHEKKRYQQEMEQWKHLHSSFLDRFKEKSQLGSWTRTLLHTKHTVEKDCLDVHPFGIPFPQCSNLSRCHCKDTSPQCQLPMTQSVSSTSLRCEKSSTATVGFETFVAQEKCHILPHMSCVTETSGSDRLLQQLAKRLGQERLELFWQIFGTCSHQEQQKSP